MDNSSGPPANVDRQIPLCVPEICGNEWAYIKECLDTNWVSSVGSFVDKFENTTAEYLGTKGAVATVNGTAALHIALKVAGVEPDHEVIVSTLTFIAPVNAIRYLGAWPVFMDSERRHWQMDPGKLKDFIHNGCEWKHGGLFNRVSGRRVKAILPVHILGHPCDMEPIMEIAREYDLRVIEDATESLGAVYHGNMVGSIGDIGCLSFNGNKLITTGGGGMITTNTVEWAKQAKYLTTQAKDDPIEYFHNEIGYNYRLTNILAALGVAQLEQIDKFISCKQRIAHKYDQAFEDMSDISTIFEQPNVESVHWLYTVLLPRGTTLGNRKKCIADLKRFGVEARPLWHPIHGLPPYIHCQSYKIEVALELYERAISLPCSVGLTDEEQEICINAFRNSCESLNGGL